MNVNETIKCNFESTDFSQSVGLNRLSDLNLEQQSILWRSNLTEHISDDMTICNHHFEPFARIFERNDTKCWDRINQHKSQRTENYFIRYGSKFKTEKT